MRKLATIRKIDQLRPIVDADAIEAAVVDGWVVVVKKGEYQVNDLAIYCEIDSWIPYDLAPFLSKGDKPREYNGVKGERLRSIKLRGTLSQGLLIPRHVVLDKIGEIQLGQDVTDLLGIQKWEAPIPAELAGKIEGSFPGFVPKTDQERCQNLTAEIEQYRTQELSFEVTEKLDGSSMTVFVNGDQEGVCSRNYIIKETKENSLWHVARREQLIEKIRSSGRNLALQGEIIGEGIQGNRYKIRGQEFHLFDIYDVDRKEYMTPHERQEFSITHRIQHVPVISKETIITENVQGLLKMAEGKSMLNDRAEREGLVFKCNFLGLSSFKVISNKFLLKND